MLSTTGFTLRAPLKFHVSDPVLTLQPICRFFRPLHSCLVVTAPKSPMLSGSVLALYLADLFPWTTISYLFSLGTAALTVQRHWPPSWLCSQQVLFLSTTFSCFFSAYLPIGFNYTVLNHGFTASSDCAVHRPSPLGPHFALGLLAYLSHRSHVLTPVWLRSPFRLSKLTPFRVVFFRQNRFWRNAFATYLVLLVFLK